MGPLNVVLWVAGVALMVVGYRRAGARGRATRASRSRTPTSPATRRGAAASGTTGRPARRWPWRSSAGRPRWRRPIGVAGFVLVFLGFLIR